MAHEVIQGSSLALLFLVSHSVLPALVVRRHLRKASQVSGACSHRPSALGLRAALGPGEFSDQALGQEMAQRWVGWNILGHLLRLGPAISRALTLSWVNSQFCLVQELATSSIESLGDGCPCMGRQCGHLGPTMAQKSSFLCGLSLST